LKALKDLIKAAALSTLDRSKHRGHDLWRDLNFFHRLLSRSPDSVLVDVGANVGQTALSMTREFPAARVFSLEPCSATFDELKKNTARFPNIVPVQLALGETGEERKLYIKTYSTTNSLIQAGGGPVREENVRVMTFGEFAETRHIARVFLLKTDTEGFDLPVLRGAAIFLKQKMIDYVLVETCFYRKMDLPQTDFGEVSSYLAQFDYHFVHMYETVYGTPGGQTLWSNSLFTCR
jgi:FkbM family methyltransferase